MGRITTQEIAKRAGVSQSTVSFILSNSKKASISEETRSRVFQAAEELGYERRIPGKKPAKALKNVIAVVVPNLLYPYYPRLIESIEKHAISRGYSIVICNVDSGESESFYIDVFSSKSVAGVIFAFTPNTDTLIRAVKGSIPAVMLGEKDENIDLDTISLNSMEAGSVLVDHLYELGHRNIAFISNPSEKISRATSRRLEGVRSRMEQLGIGNNLVQVFNPDFQYVDSLDESIRSSCGLTKRLLNENPEVSAIIAIDDITCIGIVDALRELNKKIPNDIALCSFDDTDISRILHPHITTIDHGSHMRVKFAFDLLVERITNPNKTGRTYKAETEPLLVVRDSTAKR